MLNLVPGSKIAIMTTDLTHKYHDVPGPYPTMHHFVKKMHICTHFVTNVASWDVCLMHVGFMRCGQVIEIETFRKRCSIRCVRRWPGVDIVGLTSTTALIYYNVIKWKHFPRYWPFVRGIRALPVDSLTRASDAEFWCFLWTAHEQLVGQTIEAPVIWGAITLIMTSL